jgi:hypothetical protein
MRDPNQQMEFRKKLLDHYGRCIITNVEWTKPLDAAHIMPFRQVGSTLNTGILLKKDVHFLWDKYDFSIDPKTWIIHLSKEGRKYNTDYLKYHKLKLSNDNINLLKAANIELLIQHHNNFKKIEALRAALRAENRKNGLKPMTGIFFYNKDDIYGKDEDYDIDQIYKAKDILERQECQGWEIKRYDFRMKFCTFFHTVPELSKEWIKQFYNNNYDLSGQYIRNTKLCIYTKIATEKKWVDKNNLVDAPTIFLNNHGEFTTFLDQKLGNIDSTFLNHINKITQEEGITIDQQLLGYDITKKFLWACNLNSFFDKKAQKLEDLEKIYNQRILELEDISEDIRKDEVLYKQKISKNKLEFIEKISRCHLFKNIKNDNIEKLFKFNLHTINIFFIIFCGIFIYGTGKQNHYLKWPSWIDYMINNNKFSILPIYDETLKNTNYGAR